MKTKLLLLPLAAAAALPLGGSTGVGGGLEISWYTINGGGGESSEPTGAGPIVRGTVGQPESGGTSTGGLYTLFGTIGQADAAYSRSAGGNYELLGGFLPGGPMCMVEFDDFARFAESWLLTGPGLKGDIDQDDDVDMDDLSWLADFWLCYCPTPWPLK